MMSNVVEINIFNFALIYLLLVVVAAVMKISKISQTKLLLVASIRMTIQLTLAGYIIMYMIKNPSPIFVISYLAVMSLFAAYRTLSVNKGLNRKFQLIIFASITVPAIIIIFFFIVVVIRESIFNPQYAIPIGGMVMGNAMTGISIGVKSFMGKIESSKLQIEVLLNQGAKPKNILKPMANSALEMALLPTINSMLGMGIVSLPGMMTGQILSGESPTNAILYQISINICIAAVVCLAVFLSLNFGYKTLYNKENQFTYTSRTRDN